MRGPGPPAGQPAADEWVPGQAPVGEEEGFLETAVSVVTDPVHTMRRLTGAPRVSWAVLLTVLLGALSGMAAGGQFNAMTQALTPGRRLDGGMTTGLMIGGAVLGPFFSLISLAIWTAFIQLSSLLLKGRGTYPGLFTGLAFAGVPSILGLPFQLAASALGPVWVALLALVGLGLAIWSMALQIIAIREANGFTTGRAVGAFLIPVATGLVLFLGLIVLLAAFFVAVPR